MPPAPLRVRAKAISFVQSARLDSYDALTTARLASTFFRRSPALVLLTTDPSPPCCSTATSTFNANLDGCVTSKSCLLCALRNVDGRHDIMMSEDRDVVVPEVGKFDVLTAVGRLPGSLAAAVRGSARPFPRCPIHADARAMSQLVFLTCGCITPSES